MSPDSRMGSDIYLVSAISRDEERHEAVVECCGRHRITILECDRMDLQEGKVLSEDQFDRLIHAEQWLSCIQKALTHLDYGDLSRRRMIEKLRRVFPADLSTEVADYLVEKGYIDDLSLARRYAENYYEVRGYGPLKIKSELFGKGFDSQVIGKVITPYVRMDHSERITNLLLKKYDEENLKDPAVAKKASAWLSRYGYTWSDISQVLDAFQ